MFGISKLINIIVTLILTAAFALTLLGAIASYSTVQIISDRENLRTWINEEDVRDSYIQYIVDETYSSSAAIILRGIIAEDEYTEIVESQLSEEFVTQITDSTVDQIYDWLEGKDEAPKISFSPADSDIDFAPLDDLLDDNIGFLANFIDVEDILLFSDKIELIDLDAFSLSNAPELYQKLLKLPRTLAIISIVLAIVILLSNRSWRTGLLMLGTATTLVALFIIFGKDYVNINELLRHTTLPYGISELPSLHSLPKFVQLIGQHGKSAITSEIREYGMYSLGIGIVSIAISQLEVREEEIDAKDKYKDLEDGRDE